MIEFTVGTVKWLIYTFCLGVGNLTGFYPLPEELGLGLLLVLLVWFVVVPLVRETWAAFREDEHTPSPKG